MPDINIEKLRPERMAGGTKFIFRFRSTPDDFAEFTILVEDAFPESDQEAEAWRRLRLASDAISVHAAEQ